MTALGYVAVYGILVTFASLLGGWLPSLVRLTHQRMQMMVSVVGGLMLGVALFHMLPHAAAHLGSLDHALAWMMAGLVATFLLIRAFHTHQHLGVEAASVDVEAHGCEHDHHEHNHNQADGGRGFSWLGIASGLSLHTLIDGIALAAAVESETLLTDRGGYPGIGTFLAIALHKPLDSLAITTLMASQGWSTRSRRVINLAYSLMCPLGAGFFILGVSRLDHGANATVGVALAFAAGMFLCIALADLLPEVEFHSHNRLSLSSALLAGVALAYLIGFIEPHSHDTDHDDIGIHGHHQEDAHHEHPEL